eukprot:15458354-Alexandrium_andersonii.AAC.1
MALPVVAGNARGCASKPPLDPTGTIMATDDVLAHGAQGMRALTVSAELRATSITIVEGARAPPPS